MTSAYGDLIIRNFQAIERQNITPKKIGKIVI